MAEQAVSSRPASREGTAFDVFITELHTRVAPGFITKCAVAIQRAFRFYIKLRDIRARSAAKRIQSVWKRHNRSGGQVFVASSGVAKSAILGGSVIQHQDGEWQERTAGDTGATFFYNTKSALMLWESPPAYKPSLICRFQTCKECFSTAALRNKHETQAHNWKCLACMTDHDFVAETYPECSVCGHSRLSDGTAANIVRYGMQRKQNEWDRERNYSLRMPEDHDSNSIFARRRSSVGSAARRRLPQPTMRVNFEEESKTPDREVACFKEKVEEKLREDIMDTIQEIQGSKSKLFKHVCTSVVAHVRARRRMSWITEKQQSALMETASLQLSNIIEVVIQHGTKYLDCVKNGIGRLHSTSANVEYEGELKNGVPHGIGTMTYGDGSTYKGEWMNGSKHGVGVHTSATGDTYQGEWCEGLKHGTGVAISGNGSSYDGQWIEGKQSGTGCWKSAGGELYEGEFKSGRFHGKGSMRYANGSKYVGQFENGLPHGIGAIHDPVSGNSYRGQWAYGRQHGKGTSSLGNGGKYMGSWFRGKCSGAGQFVDSNGNVYDGAWVNGEKCGQGRMTYAAGGVYVGAWKHNQQHGKGELTMPKWTYSGAFKLGCKHGFGVLTCLDDTLIGSTGTYTGAFHWDHITGKGRFHYSKTGDEYRGAFKEGKRHGTGEYLFANGNRYVGQWVDNAIEGKGKFVNISSGQTYEGDWVNNKKHGHGKMLMTSGDTYEGSWVDDEMTGRGKMTYDAIISHLTEVYTGDFVKGVRQGYGIYMFSDGSKYEGEWDRGLRDGKGTWTSPNGNEVYVGDFQKGFREGHGTLVNKETGEVYEGGWCLDKKSGLGTFRWNGLGDKYIGEFHDDKLHGKGELYRSDGSVWRGSWNCGRKSGPGSVRVSAVHATVPSYRRSGELPVKPKSRLPSLSLLEPSGYDSNVTGFPTPDVLVLKPNLEPKFDSIGSGPVSSSGKSLFVRTLL